MKTKYSRSNAGGQITQFEEFAGSWTRVGTRIPREVISYFQANPSVAAVEADYFGRPLSHTAERFAAPRTVYVERTTYVPARTVYVSRNSDQAAAVGLVVGSLFGLAIGAAASTPARRRLLPLGGRKRVTTRSLSLAPRSDEDVFLHQKIAHVPGRRGTSVLLDTGYRERRGLQGH